MWLKKSHHPFEHGLKDKQLNAASYCCFFLRDLFYKRHPSAICASKRHRRAIYTCLSTSLCTVKRVSLLMVHSSAALQLGDISDRIFILKNTYSYHCFVVLLPFKDKKYILNKIVWARPESWRRMPWYLEKTIRQEFLMIFFLIWHTQPLVIRDANIRKQCNNNNNKH